MREYSRQRLIRHLLKGNGGHQVIQAPLIFMLGGNFFFLSFILDCSELAILIIPGLLCVQIHECTIQFA